MTKKHFKPAFRQEVAELVLDKDYSIREAAEAMGIGKSTVDKWARQLRKERAGGDIKANPISSELRRIKELERENRRLKEEKEILGK